VRARKLTKEGDGGSLAPRPPHCLVDVLFFFKMWEELVVAQETLAPQASYNEITARTILGDSWCSRTTRVAVSPGCCCLSLCRKLIKFKIIN